MKYAAIIAMLILISSCTAQRQAREERKDREAVGRVAANADLTAQIARLLPPCSNDTTIITDTVKMPEIIVSIDTVTIRRNDTVWQTVTQTRNVDRIVYKDNFITDNRKINFLNDTILHYKALLAAEKEKVIVHKDDTKKAQQKAGKWQWAAFGLIALIVGVAGYKIIRIFK